MASLSEHPWYVRTQKINKKFKEETKWHKRIYLDFKCLYTYIRYRKERIEYDQQLKEFTNINPPASS